jgi:hypothetical protein
VVVQVRHELAKRFMTEGWQSCIRDWQSIAKASSVADASIGVKGESTKELDPI